jgi:multidrug resistance efflux pump
MERPPRVAIYERPAGADRPRRRWLPAAIAVLLGAAWGGWWLWLR